MIDKEDDEFNKHYNQKIDEIDKYIDDKSIKLMKNLLEKLWK
jgi:hypothetical protein